MKRLLTIILVLLMITTSCIGAFAAPRIPVYKVGNVLYFFDKSSGTITGFAGEPVDVVIPTTLGGYKVVSIGSRAFAGSTTLKSVSIPEGITSISAEAFANCPNLSGVEIASTVSHIGSKAFANSPNLYYVSLLGAPDYIETDAFDNTDWAANSPAEFVLLGKPTLLKYNGNSETVTIPYGVKVISANAFAYNKTVKEIILPDTVEKIGDNAFVHCINLEKIVIPSTVSSIGAGAFDDTKWIANMQTDFVTVNGILVAYKGNDTHVYIPHGIFGIGSGAFMANDSIRSVTLPGSVIYIDSMAFGSCRELRLADIPSSVEWIDEYAFSGCNKLTLYSRSSSYARSFANLMGISSCSPTYVNFNGKKIDFDDVAPVIHYERIYVPLRPLMELMGYTVSWDGATGIITCSKEGSNVVITPEGIITVNGTVLGTVAAPLNINGYNLMPLRLLSEAVGAYVGWDYANRTVEISY